MIPLSVWPNWALVCNCRSTCMLRLQSLCSVTLVPLYYSGGMIASVIFSYLLGGSPRIPNSLFQKNTQNTNNIRKCIKFTPQICVPPRTWSLELTLDDCSGKPCAAVIVLYAYCHLYSWLDPGRSVSLLVRNSNHKATTANWSDTTLYPTPFYLFIYFIYLLIHWNQTGQT